MLLLILGGIDQRTKLYNVFKITCLTTMCFLLTVQCLAMEPFNNYKNVISFFFSYANEDTQKDRKMKVNDRK